MRASKLISYLALFLAILFLLPSPASATALVVSGDNLVANDGLSHYRLKSPDRTWQLSVGFEAGSQIVSQQSYDGRFYVVTRSHGNEQLWVSSDNLSFVSVGLQGESVILREYSRLLLVQTLNSSNVKTFVINSSARAIEIPTGVSLDSIYPAEEGLVAFELVNNILLVKSVYPTEQSYGQLECPAPEVVATVSLLVKCDQVLYSLGLAEGISEVAQDIEVMAGNKRLGVWLASDGSFWVWNDGQPVQTEVVMPVDKIEGISLLGARVFVQSSEIGEAVVEVDWQNGDLYELPVKAEPMEIVGEESVVALSAESRAWYSLVPGSWTSVAAEAFDQVLATGKGYILWEKGSSRTQLSDFTQPFVVMPTSWAASSRLESVVNWRGSAYTLLFNSSNKVNLYRLMDDIRWSRITLPTNPTHVVTIAKARELTAGMLVEFSGIQTALPGAVEKNVIYLEESGSGIQVYLSDSKGVLPASIGAIFRVTGEVSSSKAKRVLLDKALDIEKVGEGQIIPPVVGASEVLGLAGRRVDLRGQVASPSSGYFDLGKLDSWLRVHVAEAKQYLALDEVIVPVVVDVNGSTGNIEAWHTGEAINLISRSQAIAPKSSPVKTATSPAKSSATSSKVASTPKAKTVAVSAATVPKKPTVSVPEEPLVASARERSLTAQDLFVLSLASLAAGLLVMRGRRLKDYLSY